MEGHHQPVQTVYVSRRRKDCREYALVLESLGIGHAFRRVEGEFALVVAAADAAQARKELDAYARENRVWLTRVVRLPQRGGGRQGVIGYVVVLFLVTIFDRRDAFAFDWFAAGKSNAGLIRDGQWWRALTALTLHVDLAHLMSNLVFGGLIGLFAGQLLGSGLAWASILIAGAAGNLLVASLRQSDHSSVGASTAVFAALGMVAAFVWTRRSHAQPSRLRRWAPLVGAVVLLGFLGTGGVRTDVGAHVAGFFCGMMLGIVYGVIGGGVEFKARTQVLFGMAAILLLTFAWAAALVS